jgi:hypothetical protein
MAKKYSKEFFEAKGKKGGQAWARKLKKLQQVAEKAKVADTCLEHEAPEKDDIEIVKEND